MNAISHGRKRVPPRPFPLSITGSKRVYSRGFMKHFINDKSQKRHFKTERETFSTTIKVPHMAMATPCEELDC